MLAGILRTGAFALVFAPCFGQLANAQSTIRAAVSTPNLFQQVVVNGEVEKSAKIRQAVVQLRRDEGETIHNCTATAIGPNVILTAGHCLDGELDKAWVQIGKRKISIKRWALHPKYEYLPGSEEEGKRARPEAKNDIGIAILSKSPFTVESIFRLPNSDARIDIAVYAFVSGYGKTGPDKEETLGTLRTGKLVLEDVGVNENNVANGPTNTCQGDSGGPAYVRDGNRRVILAVSSSSNCKNYGTFAKVPGHVDWIIRTAHSLGGSVPSPVKLEGAEFNPVIGYDSTILFLPDTHPRSNIYSTKAACQKAADEWNIERQAECKNAEPSDRPACYVNRNIVQMNWLTNCKKIDG